MQKRNIFTTLLNEKTHKKLKKYCIEKDIKIYKLIENAVNEYINKNNKELEVK